MTGVSRTDGRWAALVVGVALLLACASSVWAQSQPTFPSLTGRVVDQAELLDASEEAAITQKLAALETETGDQLVVVTLGSLQDYEIDDYGYRLGRAWGIGQSENDGGALLIVAPNDRQVRVEVGYGLEPILTDAFSALVIQTEILPAFRDGDYAQGIDQGVDALITQLRLDPAEAQARAQAAAVEPESTPMPIGPLIIVGLMFLFIFIGLIRASSSGGRRRRGGVSPVLIWTAANILSGAMRGGGGGGFSGGGGFGGGGGFSGGGGSFGGGGASGGW